MKQSTLFKSIGYFGLFMMVGAAYGPAWAFFVGMFLTFCGFVIGYSIDDE